MKKTFFTSVIPALLIAAYLIYPVGIYAQDNAKKKKYSINIIKDENGDKTVIDTSFTSKEEMHEFLLQEGLKSHYSIDSKHHEIMMLELDEIEDQTQRIVKIELDKAHKDLEKAIEELSKAEELHELSDEELKKLKEELKELRDLEIEIRDSENGTDHKKKVEVIIGDNKGDSREKKIFIHKGDVSDHSVMRFKGDEGDFIVIKKCHENEVLEDGEPVRKKTVRVKKTEDAEPRSSAIKPENLPAEENRTGSDIPSQPSPEQYRIKDEDFKAYPNPSRGTLTLNYNPVNTDPVSVRLIDFRGRTVLDENINASGSQVNKEFDLSGLSKGTYLLQLKQGNFWKHEKILMK